jgi:undecaprenyl-diphosphatase
LLDFFLGARAQWLTPPVRVLTELTRPSVVLVYALAVAAIAVFRSRTRWLYLPVAVLSANLLSHVLKAVIGRERPDLELQLVYEYNPAMPSGHAMGVAAFAMAVTLLLAGRRPWLVAGLWVLAVATGLTRLYLGVHWFTDVLVGYALGAVVAVGVWVLWRFFARRHGEPERAQG